MSQQEQSQMTPFNKIEKRCESKRTTLFDSFERGDNYEDNTYTGC